MQMPGTRRADTVVPVAVVSAIATSLLFVFIWRNIKIRVLGILARAKEADAPPEDPQEKARREKWMAASLHDFRPHEERYPLVTLANTASFPSPRSPLPSPPPPTYSPPHGKYTFETPQPRTPPYPEYVRPMTRSPPTPRPSPIYVVSGHETRLAPPVSPPRQEQRQPQSYHRPIVVFPDPKPVRPSRRNERMPSFLIIDQA